MKPILIPRLGKLIIDCWLNAEQATRDAVRQKHRDSNEEFITDLFRGELRGEVETASREQRVRAAFLGDLKAAFRHADSGKLESITAGLGAAVCFHDRSLEVRTGGDVGIVIARPHAQTDNSSEQLQIRRDHKQGLLCQAKMFRRTSKWGSLTRVQERVLANRLDYFALLLYRYDDQTYERRNLRPFGWHLCRNASVPEIDRWLKNDRFPSYAESMEILDKLINLRIGTDDEDVIDKVIAPLKGHSSFVIRIDWPDGKGPSPRPIYVSHRSDVYDHEHVTVRG